MNCSREIRPGNVFFSLNIASVPPATKGACWYPNPPQSPCFRSHQRYALSKLCSLGAQLCLLCHQDSQVQATETIWNIKPNLLSCLALYRRVLTQCCSTHMFLNLAHCVKNIVSCANQICFGACFFISEQRNLGEVICHSHTCFWAEKWELKTSEHFWEG